MKNNVSEKAKSYIHLTATSHDIINIANVLRYKDSFSYKVLPDMIELERQFIMLARKEKKTIQIGRTHGQHAEPITFGFSIAQYVDRWGSRILKVKKSVDNLVGKFSGSVGSYNALSLFLDNPEEFENELLKNFGLKPARISSQNISPELMLDLLHSIISSWGVLADYANDMRQLHRTEICEISENFDLNYIGSSTMPHKQNPLNFENILSAWKKFMPHIITSYMSQISEHQGDLTNSLSSRYIPELIVMFESSILRAIKITKNIRINRNKMKENFIESSNKIITEPLQILLSQVGYINSFKKIQDLIKESLNTSVPLLEIVKNDKELKSYMKKFSEKGLNILCQPENYIGIASEKTEQLCNYWEGKMISFLEELDPFLIK